MELETANARNRSLTAAFTGCVLSDDIKKHRNDIFRLVQLLPAIGELALPDPVKADLRRFIEMVKTAPVDPKSFGVPLTKDEGIEILNRFYAL